MIENAALATIFALVAPFVISWVRQAGWSSRTVQALTYAVALAFAVVAVFLQAGNLDPATLDVEQVLGYFAAILILAQALYVFLLKPGANIGPLSALQRLHTAALGADKPDHESTNGGAEPPPGGV